MANSVRAVTTERGLDPRDFALFAYGGNGPLHISLIARELKVRRVIIPPIPAVFSALGMLMADARQDVVQTGVRTLTETSAQEMEDSFYELEAECAQNMQDGAVSFENLEFLRAADMRYVGQEHTVTVAVPPLLSGTGIEDLTRAFDTAHEERYSHSAPGEPAQIVSLRVSAIGKLAKPGLVKIEKGEAEPVHGACTGRRDIVFSPAEGAVETLVYTRDELLAGNRIVGLTVIEEPTTTTLLRPGDGLEVDEFGNLLLEIGV